MDYEPGPPSEDPDAGFAAGLCATISTLEADRGALERELVEVDARRRLMAPLAAGKLRRTVERAVAEIAGLNRRHSEILVRLDVLSVRRARVGQQDDAQHRNHRPGDVGALARALVAQSKRADAALILLSAALARREALARKLAGASAVHLRHLQNPARLRGALGHYGLPARLDIQHGPPRLFAPLASADGMYLHHLLGPQPVEPETDEETAA